VGASNIACQEETNESTNIAMDIEKSEDVEKSENMQVSIKKRKSFTR